MDKLSVIITSYNQKEDLEQALKSVRAQTLSPHEILVCDDASTDDSRDLIFEYASLYPDQVKPVLHETNVGISRNRNDGLGHVTGDYVTWLDGDDVFKPTKLEQEMRLLRENPEARWAYSQVEVVHVDEGRRHDRYAELHHGDVFGKVVFMLGQAPRNPLVSCEALEAVGQFDTSLELYEDFDLMLRLAKRFHCASSRIHGMQYRVHSGGIHQSDYGRHFVNIQRLYQNLITLLEGCSPKLIRSVEQHFAGRLKTLQLLENRRLLAADVESGSRQSALERMSERIRLKPTSLLSCGFYRTLLAILLMSPSRKAREKPE